MKKSFLVAITLLSFLISLGQNELLIQNSDRGLYLNHTVTPKENFYSIGRLYNISPKEIASFNSLDMSKGLVIGEVIKIPLLNNNFSQTNANGRPIYYVVGEKEGLYRVSTKNNKVLMASLRKWNHLTNDNLSPGKHLIVGFLVSPEANNITVVNTNSIKQAPVKIEPPLNVNTKTNIATEKQESVQKREDKSPKEELIPKKESSSGSGRPTTSSVSNMGEGNKGAGYFKTQFEQQEKGQSPKADETVSAGIFKTASGWQDAKYYALIDNVDPGTIIKVINPTNNKSVYAKVLGTMSGVRQNQGYDIRISNAAANALEIADTEKFIVKVSY